MKRIVFIVLIIFASQLYAYQHKQDIANISVDALLWQLRAGSADNCGQEIAPAGTNRPITVLKVPFQFDPGFRIGINRKLNYDGWDTNFSYTWFKTIGSYQTSVSSGVITSPFLGNFFANNTTGGSITATPTYRDASMRWKLLFNTIDLELGRTFKINPLLQLRPFIGVKGGIINHHIDSNWQNPTNAVNFTSATENLKNDFWGIGPAIGFNTIWSIYKVKNRCLNIFGNVSGAILWGHWSFADLYQNNTPLSVSINVQTINGASSMARMLMGIEWIGIFFGSKMALRLGYEAQVWLDQMQFYSYNMGRLNNLMSLQGGVLGLSFYL